MNLGIAEYLSLSTHELVARGVAAREVTRRRQAMTGHRRAFSEKWIRAIGGWGGVLTLDEIAQRVGVDAAEARDYAKGLKLRAATRERRRSQAELAVLLWCDRHRPAHESCRAYGVLQVERVMYCTALQYLLDETGIDIEVLLMWSIDELRDRWRELELDIEHLTLRN